MIKAYKDAQDEIISKIEEPNLILENYLMNINKKIKFSINGQIGLSYLIYKHQMKNFHLFLNFNLKKN